MSGPEHYAEAERLVEICMQFDAQDAAPTLAAAQVHATLALAAAYVDVNTPALVEHHSEWREAVSS